MNYAYLLGIAVSVMGLRFLFKGYAMKSRPRIVTGVAIMLVGASQFLPPRSTAGVTLLFLGIVVFVLSLYMMKIEHGRIIRPNERRRR